VARKNNRPRDFERARTPPAIAQAGEIPPPVDASEDSSSRVSSSVLSSSELSSPGTAHGSLRAPVGSNTAAEGVGSELGAVSGGVPAPRRKRMGAVSGANATSDLEQTLAFVAAVGGFEKARALLAAAERVAGQVRKLLDAKSGDSE
jgi:hypothetical protein